MGSARGESHFNRCINLIYRSCNCGTVGMQLHAQCSRLAPPTDTSEALGPFARVASQFDSHIALSNANWIKTGRGGETSSVRCISRHWKSDVVLPVMPKKSRTRRANPTGDVTVNYSGIPPSMNVEEPWKSWNHDGKR